MRIEERKAVIEEFYALGLNKLDPSVAAQFFAPEASFLGIDAQFQRKTYTGADVIQTYMGAWLGNCKWLDYQIQNIADNDGRVFMAEFIVNGETKAGVSYRNDGVMVYEFNDSDKFTSCRSYFNPDPMKSEDYSAELRQSVSS